MQRLRKYLRFIAAFLVVNTLYYTFYPTIAYALTAGPTAPEATSFEPVDTTDMVNLLTGDLAYNIPLLEVPGPQGGYPMALSYHGGIMTNEEASWVGLGWTLNPGSLTRSVNGYADDHKNVEVSDRFKWEGGSTTITRIGFNIGPITAGLSIGYDTYQGSGTGFDVGLSAPIFTGLGVSVGGGVDPWGNLQTSAGLGVSLGAGQKSATQLGGSVGISTNFETVSGNASVGVSYHNNKGKKLSGVNASISSSGGGISSSLPVGGGTLGIHNSSNGKISTHSSGFTTPTPFITLGRNYTRYWIDETEVQKSNGVLHYPTESVTSEYLNEHVYDTYALQTVESIVDNIEPDKLRGGNFPNYDDYSINAQGINGAIKPHLYRNYLHKENYRNYDEDDEVYKYDIVHYELGHNDKEVQFRFVNDFSNQFQYQTNLSDFSSDDSGLATALNYDFFNDSDLITGENGSDGYLNDVLIGSKHIEYITNERITNNHAKKSNIGFIETTSTGFDRSAAPSDQIGGFVVTNESGVKYHFSLPVYAYDEYRYSENIYTASGERFNETKKKEPYAYTWFLTAMSGPDYVDRGPAGLDDSDWGYWVEFDYGKWTDQYAWRSPEEGFKVNKDYNYKDFASGKKELYYLDAVKTATHTALFVKDIRHDSKGALTFIESIDQKTKDKGDFVIANEPSESTKEGGFTPRRMQCECKLLDEEPAFDEEDHYTLDYYSRPVSTMKLEKILLVRNDVLVSEGIDKSQGLEYEQSYNYDWVKHENDLLGTGKYSCDDFIGSAHFKSHIPENVFDKYDITPALVDRSQRVIDFNHDYSLAPETINSYDYNTLKNSAPSESPDDYDLLGKLTLTSLSFLGKGGVGVTPPTMFGYDLADPEAGVDSFVGTTEVGVFTFYSSEASLDKGDILKLSSQGKNYYVLVKKKENNLFTVKNLGREIPFAGHYSWQQTKNPPYNKDAYDNWNSYKSDYVVGDTENIDRVTTKVSAQNVDAWSLRTIATPEGATIELNYESDSYSKAPLYYNNSLMIKKFKDADVAAGRVRIEFLNDQGNLEDILSPGDFVDFMILYREDNVIPEGIGDGDPTAVTLPTGVNAYIYRNTLPISSVFGNTVTIEYQNFLDFFYDYDTGDPLDDTEAPFSRMLVGGNMSVKNQYVNYGGGVRVKDVAVHNTVRGTSRKTSYDYSLYDTPSIVSGVTSCEPIGIDKFHNYGYDENDELIKVFRRELLRGFADMMLNSREAPAPGVMYENVTVSESVIGKNEEVFQIPSKSTYSFEVFDVGMLGLERNDTGSVGSIGQVELDLDLIDGGAFGLKVNVDNNVIYTTDITIKDFTTQVGNLKKVTLRGLNGEKISETINHYLHDEVDLEGILRGTGKFTELVDSYEPLLQTRFGGQGILEETFVNARFARDTRDAFQNHHNLIGILSKRERFPAIQTGQTNVNYKTGITTSDKTVGYDFYSGSVTQTLSTDGHGNHFLKEVLPAYRVNEYASGMGVVAEGGKNMLTQTAATYFYKVDDPELLNKEALISAEIQTWNDHWKYREFDGGEYKFSIRESDLEPVWRTENNYYYKGDNQPLNQDGLYPYTLQNHPSFNSWITEDPADNVQWEKLSQVTLYDRNSHALEAMDINGHYAATKMGHGNTKVISSATNSKYGEFAYSGAEGMPITQANGETYFGGEVELKGGTRVSKELDAALTHTGEYSIATVGTEKGFQFSSDILIPEREYRLSVWVSSANGNLKYSFDNGTVFSIDNTNAKTANGWYQITGTVVTPSSLTDFEMWTEGSSGETMYFDDFRIQPVSAGMTAYVYDHKSDELRFMLDNNNMYTEYRYDEIGRLISTHIETFEYNQVKTSELEYTYARNETKFDINASVIGGGGTMNPTTVQVATGANTVIELVHDECAYHVEQIEIDGQLMSIGSDKIGGTNFSYDSRMLNLSNVKGDHNIEVSFIPTGYVASGTKVYFSCEQDLSGCPTGQIEYRTADGCGGYVENSGVFSLKESESCCINTPPGCPGCTVGGGSN